MTSHPSITHSEERSRFELSVDGELAGWLDYRPAEHARSTGHPIARSAEPAEDWSWCYLDRVAFVIGAPDAA